MAYTNIQEINDKVKALEALKTQCNDAEVSITGYQDNSKLKLLLNEEYTTAPAALKKQILVLLDGKRNLTKVDKKTKSHLEYALQGQCFLLQINPLDKLGNLLPFNKINAKISKETTLQKRKFQEASILNLFVPKEEK